MLDTKTYKQALSLVLPSPQEHGGLNRVLAAAVVNPGFCRRLLDNPVLAIQDGFQGETFYLSAEEKTLVASIRADSMTDLARQLACAFGTQTQPVSQITASFVDIYGR